jgi:hypothetical protein
MSDDLQARLNRRAAKMQVQSCVRGAHLWGPIDSRGWSTCKGCGVVNTTPKKPGDGAYDRSPAGPGDM